MVSRAEISLSIKSQIFPTGIVESSRLEPDYQNLNIEQSVEVVESLRNRFNPQTSHNLWIEAFAGRIPFGWIDGDLVYDDINRAKKRSEKLPTEWVVAALSHPDFRVRQAISLLQPFTPMELAMTVLLSLESDGDRLLKNQLQLCGKPLEDYSWPALDKANQILEARRRRHS